MNIVGPAVRAYVMTMSRGHGYNQRAIVDATIHLDEFAWVALADLSGWQGGDREANVAWRRAAHSLLAQDLIEIAYAAHYARRRMFVRRTPHDGAQELPHLLRAAAAAAHETAISSLRVNGPARVLQGELVGARGWSALTLRVADMLPLLLELHTGPAGDELRYPNLGDLCEEVSTLLQMANVVHRGSGLDIDLSWLDPAIHALVGGGGDAVEPIKDRLRASATAWFLDEVDPRALHAMDHAGSIEPSFQQVRRAWLEPGEYVPLPLL